MNKTIEELRKEGYKVKVIHGYVDEFDKHSHLAERMTTIHLRDLDGNEWLGESRCSVKDQYNRKLGNAIALNRALKQMREHNLKKTIDKGVNFSVV